MESSQENSSDDESINSDEFSEITNFIAMEIDNNRTEDVGVQPMQNFNTELPSEHSYLGTLESVSGMTYYEPCSNVTLQIIEHDNILYPGEVLPMIWEADVFDKIMSSSEGLNFGLKFSERFGVTCQIFEKGEDARGTIVKVKCRAHQRFVMEADKNVPSSRSSYFAQVKILPEIYPTNPLDFLISSSLKKYVSSRLSERLYQRSALLTTWPKFVYDEYDVPRILKKMVVLNVESCPADLVLLSFWLARNIPITEKQRSEIFQMNGVTQRIMALKNALSRKCYFSCKRCENRLANYANVISMSKEGVQNYCNPNGFIHETLTVSEVLDNSLQLVGSPSNEFSWFPSYAWQILLCKECHGHIGWFFTTTTSNLSPSKFFGLSVKSLNIRNED